MGKRGSAKTPTAILERRGSWRGKVRKNEPKFSAGGMEPPADLTPDERAAWAEVVKLLTPLGVVTVADRMQLRLLASAWHMFRREWRLVVAGKKKSPAQFWKALEMTNRMLAKFGLSPVDRPNVSGSGVSVDDKNKSRFFTPRLSVQ